MSTDISFKVDDKKFNYRVCGIIVHDGRILAMKDERSPYYYLPGGRVQLGERAEDAITRELNEELGIAAKIVRPLWLNQAFFNEDVDKTDYHELCIYFLEVIYNCIQVSCSQHCRYMLCVSPEQDFRLKAT